MANMNLVTGYIGANHVTAGDAGSFNASIFGTGECILSRGNKFAATLVTNNQLRISDGDLVMQGRHVRIAENSYVDLTIENGATGYFRNDLVVARYTKNASSGVEAVNLVVIKGTADTKTASDPAYTSGDIFNGAELNDMPLYRVRLDGLNVAGVELLATVTNNLKDVSHKVDNSKATATASISASGWSGNKQTVSVAGVTADNIVIVTPAPESYQEYTECFVRCSGQGAGTLTFTCTDVPTSSLTANILILN